MSKSIYRENYLLDLLASTGHVTTGETVELLGVSEATARRLFAVMEKSGKVIRNYGGIQLAGSNFDYSFETSRQVFKLEKKKIGELAASFVRDGDTIFLDCGTTMFQMTLSLSERIAKDEFTSLNIVTNSIVNVQAITPTSKCRVILLGGEYNKNRQDFSGSLTEKYVSAFHFSKSFFGCDGLATQMGFSSNQLSISNLNSTVIKRSDMSFVLLDSSKYGKCSLVTYAELDEIEAIFSNTAPPENIALALSKQGVLTHLVAK